MENIKFSFGGQAGRVESQKISLKESPWTTHVLLLTHDTWHDLLVVAKLCQSIVSHRGPWTTCTSQTAQGAVRLMKGFTNFQILPLLIIPKTV